MNRDIQVLKTYGAAPYGAELKKLEKQIKEKQTSVNEKIGVKVIIRLVKLRSSRLTLSGIGHWACTTTSMGHSRRPTADAGRTTFASCSMHEDHTR